MSSAKTERFLDTDGTCLAELRSDGAQTVFPDSIHVSGEPIRWETPIEPQTIDGEELRSKVTQVAAGSLLARHWPAEGARQEAALALAGMLLKAGLGLEQVRRF